MLVLKLIIEGESFKTLNGGGIIKSVLWRRNN
jgi:hypothetical protein